MDKPPDVTVRAQVARFLLEGIVLLACFIIIFFGNSERDDAAAWSVVGIVVASVVRNLSRD